MKFLFPSDYFKPKNTDAAFLDQITCIQNLGFDTSVISLESLGAGSSNIILPPELGSKVVYRGWMLSPAEYELLVDAIKSTGASALTSIAEYLATHYLPNWYPLIEDLTPETKFYAIDDDLKSELTKLGWNGFFIKDYVKSLKTSLGSFIDKPERDRNSGG